MRLQQVDRTMYNRVDVHSEFGCRKWWHVGFQESKHKPASQWLFGIVTSNSYALPHSGLFDSSRHRFKDCRSMRQVGASNFHEIRPCCCARVSMGWAKVLWIVDSAIASCEKAKITKLISNARIVTFRIVTFFQKNPNGSKVRKSDIFSIFEQNMCRVLVVWGCRVLVVFFLSISGNGWFMNSTACIYAQKLKHFYIMKTYLCNVSSCLQFSLQVSTTIVQLFSHVWSWWCVCEWERLREDLREAQDASNYNNSNNHNKQQQKQQQQPQQRKNNSNNFQIK